MEAIKFYDPLAESLMTACPCLWSLDWSVISPNDDGASLVYGEAVTQAIRCGDETMIDELMQYLNGVFSGQDEAAKTAAHVGALESLAMSDTGLKLGRERLRGEALQELELAREFVGR